MRKEIICGNILQDCCAFVHCF